MFLAMKCIGIIHTVSSITLNVSETCNFGLPLKKFCSVKHSQEEKRKVYQRNSVIVVNVNLNG
jgi:hypothetical protein